MAAALLAAKYVLWTMRGCCWRRWSRWLLAWLAGRRTCGPPSPAPTWPAPCKRSCGSWSSRRSTSCHRGRHVQQPANRPSPTGRSVPVLHFSDRSHHRSRRCGVARWRSAPLVAAAHPADWPERQVPRLIVAAAVLDPAGRPFLFFLFTLIVPFIPDSSGRFPTRSPGSRLVRARCADRSRHLTPGPLRNVRTSSWTSSIISAPRAAASSSATASPIASCRPPYVLDGEKPTHLLVIAHSQGTVITLDSLERPAGRPR